MEFFMPMKPPTATAQECRITKVGGRAYTYYTPAVKDAKQKLASHLAKHRPPQPFTGAVRLLTKWCFPIEGDHSSGDWRTSRPDTDNLQKLLKDVMTQLGFWKDDALVCSEITEKFWSEIPGIYIKIEELSVNGKSQGQI